MALFPDYHMFLNSLIRRGYEIVPLVRDGHLARGRIYLRHDVDFDCQLAMNLALAEAELDVRSTFFFMLSSDSYTLFSARNAALVEAIRSLGHVISLHFDPLRYEDFERGLKLEVQIFEASFGVEVDLISIHRPTPFFLRYDQEISGVAHTYQSRFQTELKYISDSQGRFRFGGPSETAEFESLQSIHLLLHPIWWTINGDTPQAVLDAFTVQRLANFQEHLEQNCKTYARAKSAILPR